MKSPIYLLTTATILINIFTTSSAHSNLRSRDRDTHYNDAELEEDRDLITYSFNGYKTTRYYNDSYSRTYKSYASKYNKMDDQYDYDFHYNRTHYYFDDETTEEEDEAEAEDGEVEEDDTIIDDGSLESKILIIQAQYTQMFQESPGQWDKSDWILFGVLMGSIIGFISISSLCCLCCGRTCGSTIDKCAKGAKDDASTLYDGDDLDTFDDDSTLNTRNTLSPNSTTSVGNSTYTSAGPTTYATSSVKQGNVDDMVYVRLNATGAEVENK